MTRTLTFALALTALALFTLLPVAAQGPNQGETQITPRAPAPAPLRIQPVTPPPAPARVEVQRPTQAPSYRGTQAPVVNPITFQGSETASRTNTAFGRGLHKLGRGILNTFTGFLEVPKRIAQVWRDTDPVTGAVVGGIEGLGWGLARTATGIYDIVTFPIPVPANYEPLMQPEFVMPELWGATIPGLAGDR
jgi:putative exosortase-associated protein (TIGR04073 family)